MHWHWMGIWVHTYNLHCNTCTGVGQILGILVSWVSRNAAAVPWLRLHTSADCISLWVGMWVHSYTYIAIPSWCAVCRRGAIFRGNWDMGETEWRCAVMVQAAHSLRLQPTFILDIYKVFWKHLDVQWMGRWVYSYTLPLQHLCRWYGSNSGNMGHGRARMMQWYHGWDCTPLLTASHIYIGCKQSVLAPWYAVDEHMGVPLDCKNCVGGGQFQGKCGHGWAVSPNDAVLPWWTLKTAPDCIPHLYWMHTKCFSTLICSEWAYECTLTV